MQLKKPLMILLLLLASCDTKKQSLIDSQKLINKQLTGLYDSLKRVSDSVAFYRIKTKIDSLHFAFDSLSKELNKLDAH